MSLFDDSMIILGGDFRRFHSRQTDILNTFITEESLICPLNLPCASVNFTFESKATGVQSLVDHFIVSSNISTSVQYYNVL